ncbi:hypothetical protein J2W46_002708 [Paraburkholderia strydomiana]|nr:hypothetical protein [Paraburkholderia strydomiana]
MQSWPRVLTCPFINPINRCIDIQKDLYRSAGYDVFPLSIRGLLIGGFADLFKPQNMLVFIGLNTGLSGGRKARRKLA